MRNFIHSIAGAFSRRMSSLAIGAAILSIFPLLAQGDNLTHVPWEGLSIVVGKTVAVAMPKGPVITGIATRVEPDALVVNVKKTTDSKAFPKGELRVPRATLRVFQMRTKGKICRVLLTVVGAGAGVVGGAFATFGIDGFGSTSGGGVAAFVGIAAAGTAAGYLGGDAADQRWTTIEILP